MPILSRPPAPLPVNEALSWQQQAIQRFSVLWPLKAGGTVIFMLLFFWAYFSVLQHPNGPVTVMPLTVVDAWIPVTPAAFGIYASLWFYVRCRRPSWPTCASWSSTLAGSPLSA